MRKKIYQFYITVCWTNLSLLYIYMFVCLHFLPIYQILYDIMSRLLEEEFADTKGVIRIDKSKDRQHNREPLNRNQSGRFGALKSDSTHHFFGNACTKSLSSRFSQFSGCWLILSVYIIMSFDFPFVRLFGVL